MIQIILLIIALLYLIFASISDVKTREVPDWLSYSLITIALSLNLIQALIEKNCSIFLHSLIGFFAFFILGNVLYYTKQFGGGDAKILMGLGAIFINYPKFLLKYFSPNLNTNFLIILMINTLIIGALYGLTWSIVLAIKNKRKFKQALVKITKNKTMHTLKKIILTFCLFLIIISLIINNTITKLFLSSLGITILLLYPILIFVKAVESIAMYKKIPTNKLTEGDWIAHDIRYKNKLIYTKKSIGVEKKQIELIKKLKIKTVTIKEGIPFIPTFLIALIISLIFGNILPLP